MDQKVLFAESATKIVWDDDHPEIAAYLDRCQVDTPDFWVGQVWKLVQAKRTAIGKVVEFGAGDGRFACYGDFDSYIGYEIDHARVAERKLPSNARLINECAFEASVCDADVCIGNPPYVRNQDLPAGWRDIVAPKLKKSLGVQISGLANAWQYFFFKALAATKKNGLVALVVPYEWVSRPSAKVLREYIKERGWSVDVYRLPDTVFSRVLTTSSITIIDKIGDGEWRYFDMNELGNYTLAKAETLSEHNVLAYESSHTGARAKRGLSPGTQKIFVLTESERVRYGLSKYIDVVPAVTTLRHLPNGLELLDKAAFEDEFVNKGMRCWLVRTDKPLTINLSAYFESVPEDQRSTSTCTGRDIWWKFSMPRIPALLVATGFRGVRTKFLRNNVGAMAVGSVAGIYVEKSDSVSMLMNGLKGVNLKGRLVSHSNGLFKLEINQLNALIKEIIGE